MTTESEARRAVEEQLSIMRDGSSALQALSANGPHHHRTRTRTLPRETCAATVAALASIAGVPLQTCIDDVNVRFGEQKHAHEVIAPKPVPLPRHSSSDWCGEEQLGSRIAALLAVA
jgi:hypothetical protein